MKHKAWASWRLEKPQRASWLMAALLGITGLGAAQPASAEYYYSGGKKIPLQSSTSWIGVQVQPNTSAAITRGVQSEAAIDGVRAPIRVPRSNLLVLPLDGSAAQQNRLRTRLARSNSVRRVVRVYGTQAMPMIDNGDVAVRFKGNVSQAEAEAIVSKYGATVVRSLGRFAPNGFVVRLKNSQSTSAASISAQMYEKEAVLFSHPDFLVQTQRHATATDPLYPAQWHLKNTGQGQGSVGSDVKAEEAWEITKGSPAITIAVIDDGFDLTHEDFAPTQFGAKMLQGYDFIDGDNDPSAKEADAATGRDADDHGTSVAGVAAATGDNGLGVSGMAPNCKILPIRLVGGALPFTTIAAAFEFATLSGADVINNSWGYGGSYVLPDVIRNSLDFSTRVGRGGKGCVILFSAGNSGRDFGGQSADDAGLTAYEKAICVGSTNNHDRYSLYSEPGFTVDVVAPSNDFRPRTLGITTTDRTGEVGYNKAKNENGNNNNYTDDFGGTSSACPLVSGVVALLLSSEPGLSYAEVRQRLIETADKVDPNNTESLAAYDQRGHSQSYGYGRVNAGAALRGRPVNVTLISPSENSSVSGTVPLRAVTDYDTSVQSMEFSRRPLLTSFRRENLNKIIPDFDLAGIQDTYTETTNFPVQPTEIRVNVQIEHPYVGDLEITLITPDGVRHQLYDHTNSSARSLSITRAVEVATRPVTGTYVLEVVDDVQEDVGTLVSWGVSVAGLWTTIARDETREDGWSGFWNTSNLQAGKYEVRALATEQLPGSTRVRTSQDVNTNIMVAGVTNQTYKISGRITNSQGRAMADVPVKLGATTVRTNASGEYSFTGVPAGTYVVTPALVGGVFTPTSRSVDVGVGDKPNVEGVDFILLSRDSEAPRITVTKPLAQGAYRTMPVATGTATDTGGSNLSSVTGFLYRYAAPAGYYAGKNEAGELQWTTPYNAAIHEIAAKGTSAWSVLLPELPEGRYAFRATARDRANNLARSAVIPFVIDRTGPTVVITNPLSKAVFTPANTVTATGRASDTNGVEKVTCMLAYQPTKTSPVQYYSGTGANGARWDARYDVRFNELLATGTTTWSFRLPRLGAGTYVLRATATDRAGNITRSQTVVFTSKNPTTTTTRSANVSNITVAAAQSTLTLTFAAPLSAASSDATYQVSVNGQAVAVESVTVLGNRVSIGLPEGSLQRGDRVEVSWSGLSDSQNRVLPAGSTVGNAS
jgi:subtilisin family serine protease/subtilisin-like proprotein convertase family protein